MIFDEEVQVGHQLICWQITHNPRVEQMSRVHRSDRPYNVLCYRKLLAAGITQDMQQKTVEWPSEDMQAN